MSSINDFNALFGNKVQTVSTPFVPLTGFYFRLMSIDAYHKWITTGETKPDGSPKWAQDPELVLDDTGEKVRCTIELQLTDPRGMSTSPSAPFVDNKHYFTPEEVKALQSYVGGYIGLNGARIELRDTGKANGKGFARIETKMSFAFDSVMFNPQQPEQ